MELINKDALVAGIERRIRDYCDDIGKYKSYFSNIALELCIEENKAILFLINTFEVKEVDLEKEFENEDLIDLHKACEWIRKKYGEEAVVNFCKAMEE